MNLRTDEPATHFQYLFPALPTLLPPRHAGVGGREGALGHPPLDQNCHTPEGRLWVDRTPQVPRRGDVPSEGRAVRGMTAEGHLTCAEFTHYRCTGFGRLFFYLRDRSPRWFSLLTEAWVTRTLPERLTGEWEPPGLRLPESQQVGSYLHRGEGRLHTVWSPLCSRPLLTAGSGR